MKQRFTHRSRASGLVSIALGVGFAVFGIFIGVVECLLITRGVTTSATVVQTGLGLKNRDVAVEFRTRDGQTITAQVYALEVGLSPDVGDTVHIRYETDDPTFISGSGWSATTVNILCTICFTWGGFSLCRKELRRMRRRTGR
ncbi:DUF3592 domain-containing protein [Actinoallomurus sp. NPDC050550]|uniref:DUF3592 domain-containing protein n=1 Tax=Actinoallomurus sp. NPDC050550 TaxID=3154937 RepID=UPI0033E9734E